jgi:hypothetical protein
VGVETATGVITTEPTPTPPTRVGSATCSDVVAARCSAAFEEQQLGDEDAVEQRLQQLHGSGVVRVHRDALLPPLLLHAAHDAAVARRACRW